MRDFYPTIAVIFILLLSACEVRAEEECRNIRLDQNGGPMAEVPVYNQLDLAHKTDSDICYAIQAAEMIDGYRFSKTARGQAPLTSPFSIAANFRLSGKTEPLDVPGHPRKRASKLLAGGDPGQALIINKGQLVCDQDQLNKYVHNTGKSFLGSARQRIGMENAMPSADNFLESILEQIDDFKSNREHIKKLQDLVERFNPYFCHLTSGDKTGALQIARATIFAAQKEDKLEEITLFMRKLCENKLFSVEYPEPKILERDAITASTAKTPAEYSEKRNRFLSNQIKSLLHHDPPIPVGVAYLYAVMKDRNSKGFEDAMDGDYNGRGSGHGSIIVGERRKGTSCEFLVRNSYGSDCFDRHKKPKYDHDCENGNIWVDDKDLSRNTLQLSWIAD